MRVLWKIVARANNVNKAIWDKKTRSPQLVLSGSGLGKSHGSILWIRNYQLIPRMDEVCRFEFVAVGLKNLVILVGIAIILF